jgi:hypothetical protein
MRSEGLEEAWEDRKKSRRRTTVCSLSSSCVRAHNGDGELHGDGDSEDGLYGDGDGDGDGGLHKPVQREVDTRNFPSSASASGAGAATFARCLPPRILDTQSGASTPRINPAMNALAIAPPWAAPDIAAAGEEASGAGMEESVQAAQEAAALATGHAAIVGHEDGPAVSVADADGEGCEDGDGNIVAELVTVAVDEAVAEAVDDADAVAEAVGDELAEAEDVAEVDAVEDVVRDDEDVAVAEPDDDDEAVAVAVGSRQRLEPVREGAPAWTGPVTTYAPAPHTSTMSCPEGPITGGERIHDGNPPMSQRTLPETASSATRWPVS